MKTNSFVIAIIPYLASSVAADQLSDSVVANMNQARAMYGARAVTWNAAMFPAIEAYAKQCKCMPSQASGRYGETLYAASLLNTGIKNAVATWMFQASRYNFNKPGFSEMTADFTQVIWKSTTQVACARVQRAAGSIFVLPSVFIVCRYTPPGNIPNQFAQNVGRRV
ncbi:hypothetical protein BGX29_011176 [Mortierella sp. GBA35]|nr:hypothetical protein BGX29_011176 [Mortierella sp. GBA35]